MTAFLQGLAGLARLPEASRARPWQWHHGTGHELRARDALYRLLEDELKAAIAHPPPGRAMHAVSLGQQAWGELRGLLVPVPDDMLDRRAAAGMWCLRDVLAHVLLTERRYRIQVDHAAQRTDGDPLWPEVELSLSERDQSGGILSWLERIDAQRQCSAQLASLPDMMLSRPAVWAGYRVDVGFRLLRFAGHLTEHTIQAEQVLEAAGWRPGESQRVARRISAARGAHELWTPPGNLALLDRQLTALVAELRMRAMPA